MPTPSRIGLISQSLQTHLLAGFAAPDWAGATPKVLDALPDAAADSHPAGTLCVRLYHVAHNDARRNEFATARRDDSGRRFDANPPLLLDLDYLVAADATDPALAAALLERACMRLHTHPVIRETADQRLNAPTCVPVHCTAEALAALWQGLGQPMRPALVYRITAVIDAAAAPVQPLPVLTQPPA